MKTDASSTNHRPADGRTLIRSDLVILIGGAVAIVAAGVTRYAHANQVLAFVCSAVAVALLAALVARSVEQLGDRFGAGATGVLQSALGNLPELFISFFALRAGLLVVVWLGGWGIAIDAVLAVAIIVGLFLRSRRNEVNAGNAMSEVADSGKAVKVKRNPPPTRRQRALQRRQEREQSRQDKGAK